MAITTFENGSEIRYEADSRVTINGVRGIVWIYRIKCKDGSGWMHMGKQFNSLTATRKQIAESFVHDYTPGRN